MKWFKDVNSLEELRKLYRRLVVEHHPDNGGSEDIIKEVNANIKVMFHGLIFTGNMCTRLCHFQFSVDKYQNG